MFLGEQALRPTARIHWCTYSLPSVVTGLICEKLNPHVCVYSDMGCLPIVKNIANQIRCGPATIQNTEPLLRMKKKCKTAKPTMKCCKCNANMLLHLPLLFLFFVSEMHS